MTYVWQQRPLETFVEKQLRGLLSDGNDLWSKYTQTRQEIIGQVLPWIATQEPNLSDHGVNHIADVIDNAALLLGFSNQHGTEATWTAPVNLNPQELLILLTGLLLHDIGNIFGREKHNQRIPDVWRTNAAAWNTWHLNERKLITDVGRAHSGQSESGSKDTLDPLATSPRYFKKVPVRAAEIAAIIRFADELAEGPQRTSQFLLSQNLISPESKLYHQYAEITHVAIDKNRGCVALTYGIDIDNLSYPQEVGEKRIFISNLLKLTYGRAAKMNYERQFARHYSVALAPFREISVSLTIERSGLPLDLSLRPIILSDMSMLLNTNLSIENLHQEYSIDQILTKVGL